MEISGLAYFVQGWNIGLHGFASLNALPATLGILSILTGSLWFFGSAWLRRGSLDLQGPETISLNPRHGRKYVE
jgi:hypothetical protein